MKLVDRKIYVQSVAADEHRLAPKLVVRPRVVDPALARHALQDVFVLRRRLRLKVHLQVVGVLDGYFRSNVLLGMRHVWVVGLNHDALVHIQEALHSFVPTDDIFRHFHLLSVHWQKRLNHLHDFDSIKKPRHGTADGILSKHAYVDVVDLRETRLVLQLQR